MFPFFISITNQMLFWKSLKKFSSRSSFFVICDVLSWFLPFCSGCDSCVIQTSQRRFGFHRDGRADERSHWIFWEDFPSENKTVKLWITSSPKGRTKTQQLAVEELRVWTDSVATFRLALFIPRKRLAAFIGRKFALSMITPVTGIKKNLAAMCRRASLEKLLRKSIAIRSGNSWNKRI